MMHNNETNPAIRSGNSGPTRFANMACVIAKERPAMSAGGQHSIRPALGPA